MYPSIDFSWSPRHSELFAVEFVPVQGSFAIQFWDLCGPGSFADLYTTPFTITGRTSEISIGEAGVVTQSCNPCYVRSALLDHVSFFEGKSEKALRGRVKNPRTTILDRIK